MTRLPAGADAPPADDLAEAAAFVRAFREAPSSRVFLRAFGEELSVRLVQVFAELGLPVPLLEGRDRGERLEPTIAVEVFRERAAGLLEVLGDLEGFLRDGYVFVGACLRRVVETDRAAAALLDETGFDPEAEGHLIGMVLRVLRPAMLYVLQAMLTRSATGTGATYREAVALIEDLLDRADPVGRWAADRLHHGAVAYPPLTGELDAALGRGGRPASEVAQEDVGRLGVALGEALGRLGESLTAPGPGRLDAKLRDARQEAAARWRHRLQPEYDRAEDLRARRVHTVDVHDAKACLAAGEGTTAAALPASDVEATLARLRPRSQRAVELLLDGRTVEEAANVLGCSPRTVRRRLADARKALAPKE